MPRLFVFAIGGTGVRVLKSLLMLLASGIKPVSKDEFEIIPIIIDPHESNKDLIRTKRLLDDYTAITKDINITNGFFGTKISTLNSLVATNIEIKGDFAFNLSEVAGTKFKDYIELNQLSESTKAFCDVLFSGKSINKRGEEVDLLDVEMDIGFVGNPNIGSIVLNQFKDSEEFSTFASNYNADDRIFIIGSIFGGTGAAGIPIVLKNIRAAMNNENIDGRGYLKDAKIGLLAVLPYFNIQKDDESPIQKSDFIAKTKAALHYYKENICDNHSVSCLYYIADNLIGRPYINDPGKNGQKNDAHFVELASALSIIDFLEIPDNALECIDGKAVKPFCKEFGIKKESNEIKFSDLEDSTERKICLSLSQLYLFKKYIDEQLLKTTAAWTVDNPEINNSFFNDFFFRTNLTEFLAEFGDWLIEMDRNKRGFSPFNLTSGLDAMIKDRTIKKRFFSSDMSFQEYDHMLSKLSKGKTYTSAAQKLVNLFFHATKEILKSKYGLNN